MTEIQRAIDRIDRILKLRRISVEEAEHKVRQYESQIVACLKSLEAEEGKIRQSMKEFAHSTRMTGSGLQRAERLIEAGRNRASKIRQDIENKTVTLEQCLSEWREARKEYKKAEKLKERQLRRAERQEVIQIQKANDEVSVMRHFERP